MKNFISSLQIDCKRAFTSFTFFVAIALVVILNYCSVFMEIKLSNQISVMYLLANFCFSGDYVVVLLFVAALPYASVFVIDWNTQFIRFHLIRTSPDGYAWSKVITVFISAISSIILGFLLTIACFSLHMPFVENTPMINLEYTQTFAAYGQVIENSWFIFLLAQICALAIGISVWATLALFISVYMTNTFVALASPVIGYYIFINGIGNHLPIFLQQDRFMLGKLLLGNSLLTFIYTTLYCCLLVFLLGLGFVRKLKRRIDHG